MSSVICGGFSRVGNRTRVTFKKCAVNLGIRRINNFAHDFVQVIGAPVGWGQPLIGVEKGPQVIRDAGLISKITKLGWRVCDDGDIDVSIVSKSKERNKNKYNKYSEGIGIANEQLCNMVYNAHSNKEDIPFSLVLGGDHSIALGSIAGQLKQYPDLCVLWVDAHTDINTPWTSPSGNYHGMVCGILQKLYEPESEAFAWLKEIPRLKASNIVYVGLRDVDFGEKKMVKELGIKAFSMSHIDYYGIGKVMDLAMEHFKSVSKNNQPLIHLTYDIDACDPFFASATGTKVRGGLTYRESHYICEHLAMTEYLHSMDMVEVNPRLADKPATDETVQIALSLITSALGESVL